MPQHLTLRVHLPAALARQLGARRKQTGQSPSAIIVQTLERLLGDEDQTVFQTSTVNALMEGASTGDMTMGELKQHGDFGLGTFDGLDGEMLALDGHFYQVQGSGKVSEPNDDARVPFAVVTAFRAEREFTMEHVGGIAGLLSQLDGVRRTENLFYAVR